MIKIYGASDDLIEIEGDINEEFEATPEGNFIGLSNGTMLSVFYNGDWIIRIRQGEGKVWSPRDSDDEYSDVFETPDTITWAVCGNQVVVL